MHTKKKNFNKSGNKGGHKIKSHWKHKQNQSKYIGKYTGKHTGKHTKKITRKYNDGIKLERLLRISNLNNMQYNELNYKIKNYTENIPLQGFLSIDLIKRLENNGYIYLLKKNDKICGLVLFRNLTLELKKEILDMKEINILRQKIDVNIYHLYYTFFKNEKEDETRVDNFVMDNFVMDKSFMDKIISRFRNDIGINKSIVVVIMKFLNINFANYDMISKYIPIIKYKETAKEIEKLGFTYNGYHLTMHNEIINMFSMRFVSKLQSNDFYQVYSITRMFDDYAAIDFSNLKTYMKNVNLSSIENIYRYSIENSIIYYNNIYDSLYSINTVPYYNNFIMCYLSNKLGNAHIVCNYPFLYNAMQEYYGKDSKEIEQFIPIIDSIEKVQNILDDNKMHLLIGTIFKLITFIYNTPTFVYNEISYFLNNNNDLYQILNNNNLLYGYYVKNFSNVLQNIIRLKNDSVYFITVYFLITYINNIYKIYVYDKCGLLIYNISYTNYIEVLGKSITDIYTIKGLTFPDNINEYMDNPFNYDEIKEIQNSIKQLCSNIGKMYKQYVNLDINQMHGFVQFNIDLNIIKHKNKLDVNVISVDDTVYFPNYDDPIHKSFVDKYWEWINELVIKPAFDKTYITPNKQAHFQPLNID